MTFGAKRSETKYPEAGGGYLSFQTRSFILREIVQFAQNEFFHNGIRD
jgi:hypothetical protein